jgi:predicted extracellular nuclease
MKRTALIIPLLILNIYFMEAQKEITLMFYNVENFFDTKDDPKKQDEEYLPQSNLKWDELKYKNKINRISQVIDSSVAGAGLPDIVGFCEVENKQVLNDLVQRSQLKSRAYTSLCTTGLDDRGINVGLIFDKNVFDFIDVKELNATNPELGNYKTRNILFVTLKHKLTHDVLHVFVNHWPSRRDGEKETEPRRKHAAKVIRAKIDELQKPNPTAKILVMGDLNDYPVSTSVYETLGAKDKMHVGDLYNPFYQFHKKGQGTHSGREGWYVFDHIIINKGLYTSTKGLQFKNNQAFILKKDFVLFKNYKTGDEKPNRTFGPNDKYFNGYSDHLAVYIKLIF